MPGNPTVEVVVLGARTGESVVIRLGPNEWVVVDSFMTKQEGVRETVPAPLAYLKGRHVDVESDVKAVVLTHLHADHCHGIDTVVQECTNAWFYMPAAVPDQKWDRLLASLRNEQGPVKRSKVIGIATAYNVASGRGRFHAVGATDLLATAQEHIHALAPSAKAEELARAALQAGNEAQANKTMRDNFTSIVLWLKVDEAVALLGADMDLDPTIGWPRILDEHAGKEWLRNATLVKVPHHGSKHGHLPAMYEQWTDSPIGVVTPHARHKLPRDPMIATLKEDFVSDLWLAGLRPGMPLTHFATRGRIDAVAVEAVWDPGPPGRWQVASPNGVQQRL